MIEQTMGTTFMLHLEGDNNTLCDVLYKHSRPEMVLPARMYEEYLETRSQMFDDDPETSTASLTIDSLEELALLLAVLVEAKVYRGHWYLYVQAGSRNRGFNARLSEKTWGEWLANEEEVGRDMGTAIKEVKRIITAVEDGKEWRHPTQPCLDATDITHE